jgi:hypothetical protein
MSDEPTGRPAAAWRILRATAAGLVAMAALLIALIAAGTFDPRPLGALARVDHPGVYALPAAGEKFVGQSPPWSPDAPPGHFSVRLAAALADGEVDSGYGLALTGEDARLVVAVSPTGYVTIREEQNGKPPLARLPWQPWPHVRSDMKANEIWLDARQTGKGSEVTAWVNREQVWSGALDWTPDGVDLWLASFGAAATVDFKALEWYVAPVVSGSAPTAEN